VSGDARRVLFGAGWPRRNFPPSRPQASGLQDERGGFFFLVAPDLPDHHDLLGLRVVVKQLQHVYERRAHDRIAADADDRRVPETELRELVTDLIGQRPRARHEPD
jgi:hypothetical protein